MKLSRLTVIGCGQHSTDIFQGSLITSVKDPGSEVCFRSVLLLLLAIVLFSRAIGRTNKPNNNNSWWTQTGYDNIIINHPPPCHPRLTRVIISNYEIVFTTLTCLLILARTIIVWNNLMKLPLNENQNHHPPSLHCLHAGSLLWGESFAE